MGYNLYIGELTTEINPEPGEHIYPSLCVERNSGLEIGAPLNSTDNHSNEIWPSYSGWANFCRRSGLYNVFLKQYDGILVQHPGAFVLTNDQLEVFEKARDEYKCSGYSEIDVYDKRRLEWLCFWTKWALENCKVPVFANS